MTIPKLYVGSMNDGVFIIDREPHPSNDDGPHDYADGPKVVIPCGTDLKLAKILVAHWNETINRNKKTTKGEYIGLTAVLAIAVMVFGGIGYALYNAKESSDRYMAYSRCTSLPKEVSDSVREFCAGYVEEYRAEEKRWSLDQTISAIEKVR